MKKILFAFIFMMSLASCTIDGYVEEPAVDVVVRSYPSYYYPYYYRRPYVIHHYNHYTVRPPRPRPHHDRPRHDRHDRHHYDRPRPNSGVHHGTPGGNRHYNGGSHSGSRQFGSRR